jgi:hypothetical protein
MGEARAPDLRGSGARGRGHVAGAISMNGGCAFYSISRKRHFASGDAVAVIIGLHVEADIDGLYSFMADPIFCCIIRCFHRCKERLGFDFIGFPKFQLKRL